MKLADTQLTDAVREHVMQHMQELLKQGVPLLDAANAYRRVIRGVNKGADNTPKITGPLLEQVLALRSRGLGYRAIATLISTPEQPISYGSVVRALKRSNAGGNRG